MGVEEVYHDIEELFIRFKVGKIIRPPERITGGLMHKMYKVTTEFNTYAVKCLSSSIMKRDGVLNNMILSEKISNTFSKYIPVVSALSFENKNVLFSKDYYYMVFDWVDGAPIYPPLICEENCFEIGNILGKIHKLNISIPEINIPKAEYIYYDWQIYLDKGRESNAPWADVYAGVMDRLREWTLQVNRANECLSKHMVISHRDLDPKNVLWNKYTPYLIDWESGGYVNPYQELIEVLNYWCVNENGELDEVKFKALLRGYRMHLVTENIDWGLVLDSGYGGMLGWLEYSLKRALGIEGEDEELGRQQIIGTLAELQKYDKRKRVILKILLQGEN
jgi:thiamine kinase-like enzyme